MPYNDDPGDNFDPQGSNNGSENQDSIMSEPLAVPIPGRPLQKSLPSTNSHFTDTDVSITFLGNNITSRVGIHVFKVMSIIIPLLPTLALVLYNSERLESLVRRKTLLEENQKLIKDAISLSMLVAALQDERFSLAFRLLSVKSGQSFNISERTRDFFEATDAAIMELDPWRDSIKIKMFTSRTRFQIRLDDLRQIAKEGDAEIDDILNFYNTATDALLTQYGNEVRSIKGSKLWKNIIVYKNLLRAIDYCGINAAWVIKYFLKGTLDNEEMLQYLRSQVSKQEYLKEASNFHPDVGQQLEIIRNGRNYLALSEIWNDVEDDSTTVDVDNRAKVLVFTKNLYDSSVEYLNNLRGILNEQFEILRMKAAQENRRTSWHLYRSIFLIAFVITLVAPLIIVLTVKTTLSGENFIEALSMRSQKINREQRRSERLILTLLPSTVATRLIEQQKVSFSYDAATVMFCSLYGFMEVINKMEPLQLLNEIYDVFDNLISNFDVYKVENINDKYMVASGIPRENGNKHASEIARLSIAFTRKVKYLREESSLFPEIYPRIGIHSGNAVAGVIGSKMPRFCLFGETINLASRMETTGQPGKIQMSTSTKTLLELTDACGYIITSRGQIDVKGKGIVETFWLHDRKRPSGAAIESDLERTPSNLKLSAHHYQKS